MSDGADRGRKSLASLYPGGEFAGRFVILNRLGRGSMGAVYEARDLTTGATVALKLISLASGDARAKRRFVREAEAGARIESPHIARSLVSGEDETSATAFIAFELAGGPTLDVFLREHPALSREERGVLLGQLCEALTSAHQAGIVHRDLKPENLRVDLRDSGLHLWVLDFGIAKSITGLDDSATAPGLGTPLWVAPEQSREGYVPLPSSDVWAFGLLAFYVLTGQLYWRHAAPSSSLADLALELLRGELEPASVRARDLGVPEGTLPAGFDAWFLRSVNRDPAARYRDAGEASRELGSVLFGLPRDRKGLVVERPGWLLLFFGIALALMGYAISRIIRR